MLAGIAGLALVALAGCSEQSGGGAGGGSGSSPLAWAQLQGRTFLSTGVTVGGDPHPLVKGSQITLGFTADSVTAHAGCNSMGGMAHLSGSTLVVDGAGLAMTEMACSEPLMAQESWLAGLLTSKPTLALDGDTLTLTSKATVVTLVDREVADPDRALVGTAWTLDGIVSGETASSVPAGVTATLRVTEAGRIEFTTGCNQGGASVAVTPDTLTISGGLTTLVVCTGAPAQVESAVLAVLGDGTTTYSIEAATLTLTRGDAGLTYRAG